MTRSSGLLFVGAIIVTGCGMGHDSPDYTSLKQELLESKSLWEDSGITSYELSYKRECFCGSVLNKAVVISVEDSEIVDINMDDDLEQAQVTIPEEEYENFYSIEGMFDYLNNVLSTKDENENAFDRRPDEINITYDATYGYPTTIEMDWDVSAIDDEQSFRLQLLGVLE